MLCILSKCDVRDCSHIGIAHNDMQSSAFCIDDKMVSYDCSGICMPHLIDAHMGMHQLRS